ncbi:MAG: hypothetical protein K2U26_06685 [Cyclobacteriaceae bacterium]|nr:hypothetical protein [Cyclobacteriaceae bacterium]
MKTLNISISDLELSKFGIKKSKIAFSELVDLVTKELSRQTHDRSIELAEKHGLSEMTMDEINKEVKAVRKHAKGRN